MPKEQDAVCIAAHEPGTVDHVGMARQNRRQEQFVFLRVVFQVRVLDDDIVPRGGGNSRVKGCPFSLVDGVLEVLNGQVGMRRLVV